LSPKSRAENSPFALDVDLDEAGACAEHVLLAVRELEARNQRIEAAWRIGSGLRGVTGAERLHRE
jgi:hypothetical protein